MTPLRIPARPTVYKGIKMRSRLEADYAGALDRGGETWEYEPTCFAGPDGQWLPDFRVGYFGVYVEVKPSSLIVWDTGTQGAAGVYARADEILTRMSVAWLSEPSADLMLVFWTYGLEDGDAPLSIIGSPSSPHWLAYLPSAPNIPMLWPGMGQMQALAATGRCGSAGPG